MTNYYSRILTLLLAFIPALTYSQTTLIYFENFNVPNLTLLKPNSGDFGTNTGSNLWEINNKYIGQPIFPNTITQDSVQGAGNITYPDSNYLHIYDQNINTVSNANFDPNLASDRFTTLGPFCTSGDSDVHFAFFYLLGNNPTFHGELYYKGDNSPWTLVDSLSGTSKWKYEDVTDPGFENHQNLYFGFRWVNGVSSDTTTSFAIDDIKLVGTYAPYKYPVTIHIDTLYNAQPACLNTAVTIELTVYPLLCNNPHQGTYVITLSDSLGNFIDAKDSAFYVLNNNDSLYYLSFQIPSNYPTGSCYRFRVTRTDVTPMIVSDTSFCFQVSNCPNSILTQQPIMLSNPMDTICVNSVIDVPFYSYGVFTANTYISQLSDSNGNFTNAINVLGSFHSSQTYPGTPGIVSGKIIAQNQPIPPGCNYFIRVVSTNPSVAGSVYGPFCIRNCNMQTNNTNDITFCIPPGDDECIPVQLNHFNDGVTYTSSDSLQIEVHSSMDYSIIPLHNNAALGGIVFSKSDTCIHINITDSAALASLGLAPGLYYIRVISAPSQTNQFWNVSGTLIRLIVGQPLSVPLNLVVYDVNTFLCLNSVQDTAICIGGTFSYAVDCNDYNPTSTYQWFNGWQDQNYGFADFISYIFNAPGNNFFSVQETNFGCVGPGSDTVELNVYGPPSTVVTGPSPVCVGDTVQYTAPLQLYCYYGWSSSTGGTIVDVSNNNVSVTFTQPGNQKVNLTAVGLCGTDSSSKGVVVKGRPVVNPCCDTTICRHDSVLVTTATGPYTYAWSVGTDTISSANSVTVTPDTTTTYTITTRLSAAPKCSSTDTVTIFVHPLINPTIAQSANKIYTQSGYIYEWYFGTDSTSMHLIPASNTDSILVDSSGYYRVEISDGTCTAASAAHYFSYVGIISFSSNDEITIYPNPNAGMFTVFVKSIGLKKLTLKLLDAIGNVVLDESIASNEKYVFDIRNKSKGLYFLQLSEGDNIYRQKLAIE